VSGVRRGLLRRNYSTTLEQFAPAWIYSNGENLVFPHVVSCDDIAPQKILLLEKSGALAHTAGRHF
jgi:hypothetical protein